MSFSNRTMVRSGLINVYAPDIGELSGKNQDPTVTCCLSPECHTGNLGLKGRVVSFDRVKKCPKCGSKEFLNYSVISKHRADKLREVLC